MHTLAEATYDVGMILDRQDCFPSHGKRFQRLPHENTIEIPCRLRQSHLTEQIIKWTKILYYLIQEARDKQWWSTKVSAGTVYTVQCSKASL